jgi:PAS domain S-box-containing protein
MKKELKRELDFLNAVLDNAGALVMVVDREGHIRRFNRACEKLSGYTFAEIEGKFPWDTFLPPEDAAVIRQQAFDARVQNPDACAGKYTNYWVSKTGEQYLTQWSNTLLLDARGNMEFMVCVGTDITDRRQAELQLRLKDAAVEHALNAIAVADPEGRLTYVNPAFLRMWGYASIGDVLGRLATEFWMQPEQAASVVVALHLHNQWTGVLEGRRADGQPFTAELMAVSIRDGAGRPLHMVASFLDITERQRTEDALRKSEQRLREAEQMAHVGAWELDLTTNETWWSDEQYCINGVNKDGAPLNREIFLNLVHSDDREKIRQAFEQLFAKGTYEGDFRIVRPNGEVRHLQAFARTAYDETGRPVRIAGTNLDVTERKRVEAILRQGEAWLRHTQAIANVGSWELDLTTDFLKWSDETCRIFGRDPRRYGSNYAMFLDAVHPADRDTVDRAYQVSVADRAPYDITHRIVLPDGAVKWVQERGETLYDDRGKALRTIGAVQDITERKRYEAQINTANRMLSAVLDTTPVLIAYLDTNMNFVRVNRAYAEADNKDPEYFVGKNHFNLYPNPENEVVFRRVVETGEPHVAKARPFEYEHNPERGVTHWDWSLTPIKNSKDRVTGLVLSLLNVSDRIQALEAAQRSERESKALNESLEARVLERTAEVQRQVQLNETYLNTTLDGFFLVDTAGRIRDANPAFCAMLGYSEAELLRMSIPDFEANETPQDTAAHIAKVLANGYDRFETRHRRKDGSIIEVGITASLVEIYGEKLFYVFAHDITSRKQSEAELIRARNEAERANQAKSRFLSRMSHELRTPLNAILGFAQVLEMEKTILPEHKEFTREIHRAGEHLLDLINDLLDLSRIEAGKLAAAIQPLALAPIVAEAIRITHPLMSERQVALLNHGDRSARVLADPTRLRQILVNLLSNAAKYNRQGGRVTITCIPVDGDRLRISVADTGRGIPPERLAGLFKPFERLGAEQSGVDGAGIGLALSKQLAELMGADLGVESRLGQGTTFWLDIPAAGPVPEFASTPSRPEPETAGTSATVLYVEDNPANLRLVEALFRRHPQIKLLSAVNAEYGLELASRYKPDAILLDIHLPDMDGYAVLDALRACSETRDIPVVALSADAMPIDIERGLKAGFADYLTKPAKLDELVKTMQKILALRIPPH